MKSQRNATKLKRCRSWLPRRVLKVEFSVLEHVRGGRAAVKPLPNLATLYT